MELDCLFNVDVIQMDNQWDSFILFNQIKTSDIIVMDIIDSSPYSLITLGACKTQNKPLIGLCNDSLKKMLPNNTYRSSFFDIVYEYDEFIDKISEIL